MSDNFIIACPSSVCSSLVVNKVNVLEWAFDRIKEAFEKVAKDEARKLRTVQEIM